jgi:nucleoside-diphosphate-sugar epimerase
MTTKRSSVLVIGGSGFLSGHVVRLALERGHEVWALTRGQRALPDGVHAIAVDRHDREGFARAVRAAGRRWDLVIDCVAYEPGDARQDLEVFRDLTDHLVFVSTDMVFDPNRCVVPTPSNHPWVVSDDSYGGLKRRCEEELERETSGALPWTIVRPCHIYGPGWPLGCLPYHFRDEALIGHLRERRPLRLLLGGLFLHHPVYAPDLAAMLLSCQGNDRSVYQTYLAAGPVVEEARGYYAMIGDALGVPVTIEEAPLAPYLAEHPEHRAQLRHRIYDLSNVVADGLEVPSTRLDRGLAASVAWLAGRA